MSRPEPSRTATLALAVAGGLVTDASFPDRGWWFAAPVGVGLLILALRRDDARWGAVVGFVWGLSFFLPHIHWLNLSVGAVPWIALSIAEAAFVAALGAAWVRIRRTPLVEDRPIVGATIFAAAWVVAEQGRSAFPFGGFPWGRLAFSQADSPVLSLASIGGAPLVSAVVAAAGALLALGGLAVCRHPRRSVVALGVATGLLVVGYAVPLPGGGSAGIDGSPEDALRVGVVQGNVETPGLDAFAQQLEVLRNHADGTAALVDDVPRGELDLVVWPENAADLDPRADSRAEALVSASARAVDAPILVGTLRYDDLGRYNESVLWTPADGPVAVYTKQHPAPFAEYIPMRAVARLFSDKVDLVRTDMLPGTGVGVIDVPVERWGRSVPVADVICFEVAYDGLVREAVRAGGEVVVVQTNNASFGRSPESTQQLAMTRLRAVEHGRAAIQASTVGVSGVVAPDGTLLDSTGLFTADRMVAAVPVRSGLTVADRAGDAPVWVAAGLVAVALLGGGRGRRRKPGDRAPVTVVTGGAPGPSAPRPG